MEQSKTSECLNQDEGGVVKTPHPVCLIENTNENGLNLNRQAMDILSSITKPVVVAEVVGKFPTGDSYLANRLFGQCTGCHNHSESSDIWMWCVPYPHIKDSTLVLLDKGKNCLNKLTGDNYICEETMEQSERSQSHNETEVDELQGNYTDTPAKSIKKTPTACSGVQKEEDDKEEDEDGDKCIMSKALDSEIEFQHTDDTTETIKGKFAEPEKTRQHEMGPSNQTEDNRHREKVIEQSLTQQEQLIEELEEEEDVNNLKTPQSAQGDPVVMAYPVCLIENIEENKVKINQEALAILSSISQPVVVVSIVGKYRTGKSYLMNRLAGKRTGFSLGSTVQSNTKGIWMWCVPHPRREGQTLVLLDTEGLGDVEKDDLRYDSYVFTLAILLSSTLVYNTKGTIDNEELLRLQYMTELTKLIHVRSTTEDKNKASSEFIRFFPSFVWVVRDFTLELEIDGKEVTTDRYLENALKLKQGNSEEIRQSNILRECIRNYFPSRKCFVFYQPTNRNHHNLEKLNDADLDPDFVKQTNEFCSYIFDSSKEKTIAVLGQLAVMYVEAIHSGQVPCLENAVDVLAQRENASLADKSYDLYQNLLGEQVVLPTETQQEFSSVHEECMKKALKLFMEHSFKDGDQRYQNFLMTCIQKEYERKCQENEQLSYKHCTDLLEKLWGNIDHKSYMRPGGYLDYRATVDGIIKKYKATPQKGLKAEEALQTFLKQKEDMESCILKADHSLTEQQKKLEEEKAHAEVEKFKAEVVKKKEEALNQRIKDIEKAYKENEQQLVEKMERERNTMIEENKRILEKRLQEEKTLTEEGFNQKAKVISAIIEELQEEQMKLFFSENYGPELKDPSFSFAKISRINEQKEN